MVIPNISPEQANYLQNYVNSVAGFVLPITMVEAGNQKQILDALMRREESECKHRDQWGNWEGSYSEAYLDGQLSYPYIDDIIHQTTEDYLVNNQGTIKLPKYPESKPFAICLTHDVDNINYYPALSILFRAINRYSKCKTISVEATQLIILKTIKDMLTHSTKYLHHLDFNNFIELEERLGFKSTFYCFAEELPNPHYYDSYYKYSDRVCYKDKPIQFKDLLKEIHTSGWDIGLHGSYNSAFDLESLRFEKQSLEQSLGMDIQSTRQHWMHYSINKTPQFHDKLGFKSDSTLGFNRHIGFRSGTSHPHMLWDIQKNSQYNYWEIPLHIMDGALFYANALELNEEMAINNCLKMMDRVEAVGGVLTVNWHPDHLNKQRFWSVYLELLQEARRRNAWGCSAAELAKHWDSYTQHLITP